jgi:hypothetical protein
MPKEFKDFPSYIVNLREDGFHYWTGVRMRCVYAAGVQKVEITIE